MAEISTQRDELQRFDLALATDSQRYANRLRLAELTSGIGAVILGIGLGVLLASLLASYAVLIVILGAVAHGWGMLDKHRLERRREANPPLWSDALYWICWASLVVLVGYLAVRSLQP